jgi:serine/threonine protein kinase
MDNEAAFAHAVDSLEPPGRRDEWLKYIAETYLVSAPGDYILGRSLFNTDKDMPNKHYIVRVGTPVRVMLMERLGKPLKAIPEVVGRELKSIAKQGLQILRKIHEIGFVHGDVHDGNFVLSSVGGSASAVADGKPVITIKAIDFGQSMRYVESSEEDDYPIGQKSVRFLSISELEEKFPAPKDDLFRWGETLMNIVTKGKYFSDLEFEIGRCTKKEMITKALEWKIISAIRDPSNQNEAVINRFIEAVRSLPYNAKPGDAAYDVLVSFFD